MVTAGRRTRPEERTKAVDGTSLPTCSPDWSCVDAVVRILGRRIFARPMASSLTATSACLVRGFQTVVGTLHRKSLLTHSSQGHFSTSYRMHKCARWMRVAAPSQRTSLTSPTWRTGSSGWPVTTTSTESCRKRYSTSPTKNSGVGLRTCEPTKGPLRIRVWSVPEYCRQPTGPR